MNKFKCMLIAVLCMAAVSAHGQVVMRGETSPGVYTNVNVDGTGAVKTTGGGGATGSASGVAVSGNPTRIGSQARTSNYAAVANGSTADAISTSVGVLITKPYSIPEADWVYAAPVGGIITNTDIALASGFTGFRNYVTGCSFINASSSVASELVIKDGSGTLLWRGYVGVSTSVTSELAVTFRTPLHGVPGTSAVLTVVTTGAQVYASCQGYLAP